MSVSSALTSPNRFLYKALNLLRQEIGLCRKNYWALLCLCTRTDAPRKLSRPYDFKTQIQPFPEKSIPSQHGLHICYLLSVIPNASSYCASLDPTRFSLSIWSIYNRALAEQKTSPPFSLSWEHQPSSWYHELIAFPMLLVWVNFQCFGSSDFSVLAPQLLVGPEPVMWVVRSRLTEFSWPDCVFQASTAKFIKERMDFWNGTSCKRSMLHSDHRKRVMFWHSQHHMSADDSKWHVHADSEIKPTGDRLRSAPKIDTLNSTTVLVNRGPAMAHTHFE